MAIDELCCAVLCCAVLCCAVLCCAVLCCAVLCCAVLCCAVLCCAVLCCVMCSSAPCLCTAAGAGSVAAELEKVKTEYMSYRRKAMELLKEKEDQVTMHPANLAACACG